MADRPLTPLKPQTLIFLLILSQAFDVMTTYMGTHLGLAERNALLAPVAHDLLQLVEFKLIFYFPAVILPVILLFMVSLASASVKERKKDDTGDSKKIPQEDEDVPLQDEEKDDTGDSKKIPQEDEDEPLEDEKKGPDRGQAIPSPNIPWLLNILLLFLLVWSWAVIVNNIIGIIHLYLGG